MRKELNDGTIIEKGDDGSFVVTAWGYPEIRDSEGHRLPVDEIINDTPLMMAFKPKIHLHHTDTEVGDIVDIWKSEKKVGEKMVPSPRVKYSLYGTRRYQKAVRSKVEKGELGMVSIKGFAFGKSTFDKEDGKDVMVPHDMEIVTYALCSKGKNPEAKNDSVMVNGRELMKSDDISLLTNEPFLKEVRSYMNDGLSYQSAMKMAKETHSDELHKELENEWDEIAPQTLEKMIKEEGDKYIVYDSSGKKKLGEHSTESGAKEQLAAIEANKGDEMDDKEIEAIRKEVEDLKKANEELQKEKEEVEKAKDGLKSELDELKKAEEEAEKETEESPEKIGKAEVEGMVEELMKAKKDELKNEIIKDMKENPDDIMKALGFTKAEGGAEEPSNMKQLMKSFQDNKDQDGLKEFYALVEKAKEANDNTGIDDIPSVDEMEKAIQREAYGYTEGGE